jgi:bifunctional non-homologous end joining protein LigD
VAAYSLRGRPEPTVSTPVTWDEVRHCHDRREASLLSFTAGEVLERVDDLGDLFSAL